MGIYKMKTEGIKIHGQNHENDSRSLGAAATKTSVAEDFAVAESTLRKRLKTEAVQTSLDRFRLRFRTRKRNIRFAEIQKVDCLV
jgi:hypothetical protein